VAFLLFTAVFIIFSAAWLSLLPSHVTESDNSQLFSISSCLEIEYFGSTFFFFVAVLGGA
jgi:hypothetical protein